MLKRESTGSLGQTSVRRFRAVCLAVALAGSATLAVAAREPDQEQSSLAEQSQEMLLDGARHHAPLRLTPCAENAALDCGTLTVPVDYQRPYGETVGIAVIRARSINPARRIGVLVGNPGGPGVSGVDFVLGGVQAPSFNRLREYFDIVSFDPRGVKRTRQVRCQFDPPGLPSISDDVALADFFNEYGRRFAQACLEQNGSFVTHIGTMNAAPDIDIIRRALGERQITYAAGSYGSELGATYASMFPKRVRAMMLDGGIAPQFRDFNIEAWSAYSQGFELTFQRLDQLCRRDAGCRLQGTGAVAAMDELLARLTAGPVTSPSGAVLTAGRLQNIVAFLLGNERNWPLTVNALADAAVGNYSLLFQLIPASGGGGNTALYPIWCNDYGTRRAAADYLWIDQAIGALHPRFFGRFFVAEGVALCASWPAAEPPVMRDVSGEMTTPVLLVGNDFDPNTPLVDTRQLAKALGMEKSLIRYEGGGHTAYFKGIACIETAIENYLIERRVPPVGFSCAALPVSFGPSAAARTAAADAPLQIETGLWSAAPILLPSRER